MKIKKLLCTAVCGMTAAALSAAALSASAAEEETNGYAGSLTVTPGAALSESLGIELKDVTADFAYKNDKSAVTAGISYGGQSLATVEANYDSENGRLYFRIPELSDEVLYIDLGESDDTDIEIIADPDFELIDLGAVSESLTKYAALITGALGEGEIGMEEGDLPGDISYSYSSITYDLTSEQIGTAVEQFAAAAEGDETLIKLAGLAGYEGDDAVGEMISDFVFGNTSDTDENYVLTLMFDGQSLVGAEIETDSKMDSIIIGVKDGRSGFIRDSIYDLDGSLFEEETSGYYAVGEDGALSGEILFNYGDFDEQYSATNRIIIKDLFIDGDIIKGDIGYISSDSDGSDISVTLSLDLGETEHKVSAELYTDGELLLSVDYSGAASLFKDVTLETEGAYNALDESELDAYLSNADTEGFLANAKEVLGEDLYDLLFGGEDTDPDSSIPDNSSESSSSDNVTVSTTTSTTTSVTQTTTTTAKSGDSSPETGAAAGAAAAVLLAAAGAVALKKK